jgi:hypothetical protein
MNTEKLVKQINLFEKFNDKAESSNSFEDYQTAYSLLKKIQNEHLNSQETIQDNLPIIEKFARFLFFYSTEKAKNSDHDLFFSELNDFLQRYLDYFPDNFHLLFYRTLRLIYKPNFFSWGLSFKSSVTNLIEAYQKLIVKESVDGAQFHVMYRKLFALAEILNISDDDTYAIYTAKRLYKLLVESYTCKKDFSNLDNAERKEIEEEIEEWFLISESKI